LIQKVTKKIKQEKTFCAQGHTPGPVFLQAFALLQVVTGIIV
jgi:hypothetical protein